MNQAVSAISPDDLRLLNSMTGDPSMPPAGPQPQVSPALLNQLMAAAPSAEQQNAVNANQLNMMSSMGVIPQSDPNGFTNDQPQIADAPSGGTMTLPPNTGAENAYGTTPAPQREPQGSTRQQGQKKLSDYDQFMVDRGYSGIPLTERIFMQANKEFHEIQMKKLEMQDPERKLRIQKGEAELQKSTMEQADAVAKKADAIPELENNIQLLDDLLAHQGLSSAVGAKDAAFLYGLKKDPLAGTAAADFTARLDQVQGKNFLMAFNQLKGAGQITEIEGAKAQAAIGRLGTNQSEGEFRKSVGELRGILQSGLDRSKARLGTQAPSATPPTVPSTAPAAASPMIKTIPGRGTFQSLGNGQWKQIQ
jgi:hypothetical protein